MPFSIVRDDIVRMDTDAIVNAANERLWMGGGVCGAIFRAAGARALQAACDEIGHCPTGSAVATPGFDLAARYIIHTVGPVWGGGAHGERELLASCYRTSLELAESLGCTSIAFPLISAGIYGYPHRDALTVAQETIRAFLDEHEMEVYLVLYDAHVMAMADTLRMRVERYIDDVYVGAHAHRDKRLAWEQQLRTFAMPAQDAARAPEVAAAAETEEAYAPAYCPNCGSPLDPDASYCPACGFAPAEYGAATLSESLAEPAASAPAPKAAPASAAPREVAGTPLAASRSAKSPLAREQKARRGLGIAQSLKQLLTQLDAGFSETLLALIDERGLTDAQVYKKANLSRQHFSKIRSNPHYQPTKTTVLALAVALELSLDETSTLLKRAGFALNHADCRDVIVEFFIREGIYDVFEINNALFSFDQPLLS